jgi:hypothetical protein
VRLSYSAFRPRGARLPEKKEANKISGWFVNAVQPWPRSARSESAAGGPAHSKTRPSRCEGRTLLQRFEIAGFQSLDLLSDAE